jgi:L-cysteine desulfidase
MDLHSFFTNEVKPALGCTEPVAGARAAPTAARELADRPERIGLKLSINIFKNGRDVGIPGTDGLRGNAVAAALGALAGDPAKGLLVLQGVTAEDAAKAKALVDAGRVTVEVLPEAPPVFIEALLEGPGGTVLAEIRDRHDHVSRIVVNGRILRDDTTQAAGPAQPAYLAELMELDMAGIWDLAGSLDAGLEAFMLQGVEMNMAVAHKGLTGNYGLGVGLTLTEHGGGSPDLFTRIKSLTGAAADVRMSGAPLTVMSSAGSGNHGITAIVPLAVTAQDRGATPRQLAEAVALSHLVTGYVKGFIGRLTPICGCSVAAGAGAAAGLVRIMGGTSRQAERAVASLISALMGMLCDGAKGSCGLKVSAAAGEAYAAALMAMDERGVQHSEGLVSPDMRTTAKALAELCEKAFSQADRIMVGILQEQTRC